MEKQLTPMQLLILDLDKLKQIIDDDSHIVIDTIKKAIKQDFIKKEKEVIIEFANKVSEKNATDCGCFKYNQEYPKELFTETFK